MNSTENVSRVNSLRTRPNLIPIGPRTPLRSTAEVQLPLSPAASRTSSTSAHSTYTSPVPSEPRVLSTVQETFSGVRPPVSTIIPDFLPPAYSTHPEPQTTEITPPPRLPIPPRILTPPEMRFESPPVEWKALSLEAALWTFSSAELQQIVSRAIRSSARESFIRLLTVENLDNVLPAELENLEKLKASTQSKYRFLVHRRTMLLQALITSAQIPSLKDKGKEDNMDNITKLALQLSETTAECDRLLEELLKISDQTAQINRMLDVHWASALAIALRKLNNSYGRRTTELQQAREQVTQLEGQLEDAWKEAEKLAREMDEYEEDLSDAEGEAVIETAEIVSVPITPTSPRPRSVGTAPTLLDVEVIAPCTPLSPRYAGPTADIPADVNAQESNQDSLSIRSGKSVKSFKSTKSARSIRSIRSTRSQRGDTTRSQHVFAAKTRSYRTSQGSLRLPASYSYGRKPSSSRPKTPVEEQPPVPDIPLQFTSSPVISTPVANASSTLLHWDSRSGSPVVSRSQGPMDEGQDEIQPSFSTSRRPANLNDINLGVDDNAIEEVLRTPARKNISVDDVRLGAATHSPGSASTSPTSKIPSIWRNVDAPKTPAERVESLMRRGTHKPTPYQKLRTLTKRYSLPFPLLTSGKSMVARHSSDRS